MVAEAGTDDSEIDYEALSPNAGLGVSLFASRCAVRYG